VRQELTGVDGDIGGRTPYGLQGQVYRQLRVARPLPGGRLLKRAVATRRSDKWRAGTGIRPCDNPGDRHNPAYSPAVPATSESLVSDMTQVTYFYSLI